MKLDDHEPEKIEWLLRFIYHQDLKWHKDYVEQKGGVGFLPMLIELIILGDYFLVHGLIDAARVAIVDVCTSFGFRFWCDEPGDRDKDTSDSGIGLFAREITEAIALTSAETGPTRPFRMFLVKFLLEFSGSIQGVLSLTHARAIMLRRRFGLAAQLRAYAAGVPGLEDELKATLFDTAFPQIKGEKFRFWPGRNYPAKTSCFKCGCHLNDMPEHVRLLSSPIYVDDTQVCCVRCAKHMVTVTWREVMMKAERECTREPPAGTDKDP